MQVVVVEVVRRDHRPRHGALHERIVERRPVGDHVARGLADANRSVSAVLLAPGPHFSHERHGRERPREAAHAEGDHELVALLAEPARGQRGHAVAEVEDDAGARGEVGELVGAPLGEKRVGGDGRGAPRGERVGEREQHHHGRHGGQRPRKRHERVGRHLQREGKDQARPVAEAVGHKAGRDLEDGVSHLQDSQQDAYLIKREAQVGEVEIHDHGDYGQVGERHVGVVEPRLAADVDMQERVPFPGSVRVCVDSRGRGVRRLRGRDAAASRRTTKPVRHAGGGTTSKNESP